MNLFCIVCLSSSFPTATPHTSPSWSTTRGPAQLNPPALAWSCGRGASDWALREATFCANAITSFVPSPSSQVAPADRPVPASQGGLSARRASVRWSGSGASSRPLKGAWASLPGAGAAALAPGRAAAAYWAQNKLSKGICCIGGLSLCHCDLWARRQWSENEMHLRDYVNCVSQEREAFQKEWIDRAERDQVNKRQFGSMTILKVILL